MAFSVEQLSSEPIFIIKIFPPESLEDSPNSDKKVQEMAQSLTGRVAIITDSRDVQMKLDFNMIIDGLDVMRRTISTDPRWIRIIVGSQDLVGPALDYAKQKQYGAREIPLFSDLEPAIEFAREALKTPITKVD